MKKLTSFLCFVLTAVLLSAMLVSCSGKPAATAEEAIAALKKAKYAVTVADAEHELKAYEALGAVGVTCVVSATQTKGDEVAYIYYFADAAAAEAALESVKALAQVCEEQAADGVKWVEPTVQDSMVYFGSQKGVAAAK